MKLNIILILIFINNLSIISNSKLRGRIINGELAYKGQFPWYALLSLRSPKVYSICGGSLISSDWILTASHCLDNVIEVNIKFGIITRDDKTAIKRHSKQFYKHPDYNNETFNKDIALIKLDKSIEFNDIIKPVLLPPRSLTRKYLQMKICKVCGFGKDKRYLSKSSFSLRYTNVRIATVKFCNKIMILLRNTNSAVCTLTTRPKQSPCIGDSGGGLIYQKNDKNYIVGVVSFGSSYCIFIPTVFQTTINNLDWISKITGIKIE